MPSNVKPVGSLSHSNSLHHNSPGSGLTTKALAPDLAARIGSTRKTKFRGDPDVFARREKGEKAAAKVQKKIKQKDRG